MFALFKMPLKSLDKLGWCKCYFVLLLFFPICRTFKHIKKPKSAKMDSANRWNRCVAFLLFPVASLSYQFPVHLISHFILESLIVYDVQLYTFCLGSFSHHSECWPLPD